MTEPSIHWKPINPLARAVTVGVKGWEFGWTAYLGDFHLGQQVGDVEIQHIYAQPGCYWLYVTKRGESTPIGQEQIVIRPGTQPDVRFSRHPDNPATLCVHWPDLDETRVVSDYTIDWTPQDPHDPPVEYTDCLPGGLAQHTYPEVGQYRVTVTDHATRRMHQFQTSLPIPVEDPDFSVATDPADPFGLTIVARIDALARPGQALRVDFDDPLGGTSQEIPAATVGATATHTYRAAGPRALRVTYADGTGNEHARDLITTIPLGGN